MWRSWKQVWTPVAWNCESTCSGVIIARPPPSSAQAVDQLVELLVAHEAAHRAVVDQHHRRIGAGAEALALLQREQAVGAWCSPIVDAELLLEVLERRCAVAQLARQVGADVELELAHRLLVVHVVEGRDLVHRDRRHAEVGGDLALALRADEAFAPAARSRGRPSRPTASARRVLGDLAREALQRGGRQRRLVLGGVGSLLAHRSISPNTMSMVPITATASAIMWPRAISSSAARCGKPGARIFRRYGLLAPSLTR